MKKGISYWTFGDMPIRECFRLAKETGFDGVELTLDPTGELTLETTDEQALAIKAAAAEEGIELYSLASGYGWIHPVSDNDPAVREKAEQVVRRQLELAALLGCDTILLVPAVVTEEVAYDVAYQRAMETVKRLAAYAEEKGVVIALENVWNKFLLSPMEMARFIDEIGSPYVKAYFDVGNVVVNGYPEQWIRILGDRIAKVHFKDYRRDVGNIYGFTELLTGDVDYKAVMQAFRDVGYDNWVTGELTPYKQFGPDYIATASRTMGIILSV
ncbi:MAG: sugar phosphate isomerase/epimerase [Clostridia bacterium]|nr:sugar phosphate isomerase/epimerase [Clostridia bacterium]